MKTPTALQKIANPAAEKRQLARLRGEIEKVAVSSNPAAAYLGTLGSDVSRRVMKSPLNTIARLIDPSLSGSDAWQAISWHKLTAPAVRLILARIKGSPATRNKALSALKGVARMAWEMKTLDTDELERIRGVKGDSGTRELSGRSIPEGEVRAVLQACAGDPTPAGARDIAMISVAAVCGARRAEIASLDIEQMKIEGGEMVSIKVIGKGNRQRTLYVVGNAFYALQDWLEIRGMEPGAVFCRIAKGGRIIPSDFISPMALDKILAKRSRGAHIDKVCWHDFRRTTASNFLDAGADISTVAGILGHANVQTTARYDRRGERAKKKAAGLLSVPYYSRVNA